MQTLLDTQLVFASEDARARFLAANEEVTTLFAVGHPMAQAVQKCLHDLLNLMVERGDAVIQEE